MTAKEYLKQIRKAEVDIVQLQQELDAIRTILTSTTADPAKEHIDGGNADKYALVDSLIELEAKLESRLRERQELRAKVTLQIQGIDNSAFSWVLYLRYVSCLKFEHIAERPPFYPALDTVYKWHRDALNVFAEKYKAEIQSNTV